MNVWTCSMYSGETGATFILGVFSEKEKAEQQVITWLEGLGEMFEETDRTNDPYMITIYYETIRNRTPYTATLEEFKMNELSY